MGRTCKYRRDKDSATRQRAGRCQRSFQMLEPRLMLAADLRVDLSTGPDDPLAQVGQVETVAPANQPIPDLPAPTATDADSADRLTDGTNTDTQANTVTDDHRQAVADVGVDRVVIPGAIVILDGTGSSGDISAYLWKQLSQPVVQLTGHNTATASLMAPLNTSGQNLDLVFQLTVAEPTGLLDTAVVLITVEPLLPAQLIGNVVTTSPVTIASGQTLDLGCFNLTAPSVMIETGGLLTGSGSVAAPVSGGGEITLFGGNMSLGDLNHSSGFDFHGTLNLNGNTAILLDANVAQLGAVTDLGSGGTLVAANGIKLASRYSLTGSGTIDNGLVHQGTLIISENQTVIVRDNLDQSSRMAVATSSSAEGEPVIVNTTIDENDGIDNGGISLRDAVAHAATHTDPLDILFANALEGQTIPLDSAFGDLQINSNLVIDGEEKNISISGGDATSIFRVTGDNVTINNLTLPTVVIESSSTLRLGGSVTGDLINNGALAVASDDTYTPNPDLNETPAGMLNAALSNRNPDCRTYALDANDGDYSSVGADDRSNFDEDAPYYPGTDVVSTVHIDPGHRRRRLHPGPGQPDHSRRLGLRDRHSHHRPRGGHPLPHGPQHDPKS